MDKSEWFQLYQFLQARETRCEKELVLSLETLKLGELLPASRDEQAGLLQKISKAKLQVAELQLEEDASQPTPSCIQSLASNINSVTQQLNQLKALQRQQYSALLQQEQQLLEELDAVQLASLSCNDDHPADPHISYAAAPAQCKDTGQQQGALLHAPDSPSKQAPAAASAAGLRPEHKSSTSNTAGKQDSTLPPEVIAYDSFLARHGNTGGWHPDDHTRFLSVLRRCKGDYAAVLGCVLDELPRMTRQSVITHCRWHVDLTELDMRRRVALVAWRTSKDAAATARQAEVAALGDDYGQQQMRHTHLSRNVQQEELQSRLQHRNQAALQRRQQLQAAQQERQAARSKAQQQLLASIQVPRVDRSPGRLLSATAAAAARSKYVAYRSAGCIAPFHVRRTPYKVKLFTLDSYIIKEYSGARDKVEKEVAILQQLHHENLISFLFVADQGSRISIVMDWAGESLRRYRTLSVPQQDNEAVARHVVYQLTNALVYLHSKGIIHRDIKPDNIGVHKDHKVALFDWGEALTTDQVDHLTDRALAQQVGVAGTPLFMPPEVLNYLTDRDLDPKGIHHLRSIITTKVDTWGLGTVLFFLLAGRDIFVNGSSWELSDLADIAGASTGVELPLGVEASYAGSRARQQVCPGHSAISGHQDRHAVRTGRELQL
eukprot:gene2663-2963_t